MRIRFGLICILLSIHPASGEWRRYWDVGNAPKQDTPNAHPLAYFRQAPCRRPDLGRYLHECKYFHPESAPFDTRTTLHVIGRMDGFTVYDLHYFLVGETEPHLRSVLVGLEPDEVHEIHVQANEPPLETLFPTRILSAGQDPVIRVKWDDGGNMHFVYEDYYLLTRDGAIRLDFESVFQAAQNACPPNIGTYQPTSSYDFNALVLHVETERTDLKIGAKVACCEGRVEVPFRVVDGKVIPGQARYHSDRSPQR